LVRRSCGRGVRRPRSTHVARDPPLHTSCAHLALWAACQPANNRKPQHLWLWLSKHLNISTPQPKLIEPKVQRPRARQEYYYQCLGAEHGRVVGASCWHFGLALYVVVGFGRPSIVTHCKLRVILRSCVAQTSTLLSKNSKTNRHTDRPPGVKRTDSQTGSHTDRQTGRQTDRQTDRHESETCSAKDERSQST
jgi:hypothetical protein